MFSGSDIDYSHFGGSKRRPAESSYKDILMAIPAAPAPQQAQQPAMDIGAIMKMAAMFSGQPAGETFTGNNPQYALPQSGINTVGDRLGLLGDNSASGSVDMNRLVNAVGQLESGNNYKSVGVRTKSGDRAYGFSQVMGENVPAWTEKVLGYRMTPQDYLNDPEAQKAVTKAILSDYVSQYGNMDDAVSMWFSGKPARNNNRHDALGTTVPQYIKTVRRYY